MKGYILLGSVCADTCPDKYYEDSDVCLPCDAKCKACVGKTNYCVDGCESSYLFKDHKCVSDCGNGYTANNGACEACDEDCTSCTYLNGTKTCTKCGSGKFLYLGSCVQLCPTTGYYTDSEAGACKSCNVACTKCVSAGNKACTACDSSMGYMMVSANVCDYPTCSRGTYFNVSQRSCKGLIVN